MKNYVGCIKSDEFKKKFPNLKPKNVVLKVVCKNEPTAQKKQIDKVTPHGDEENMIAVKFEIFK